MSQHCNWCHGHDEAVPAVAVVSNDVWAYAVCDGGLRRAVLQQLANNGALRVTGPDTLDDYAFAGNLRKGGVDNDRLRV